MAHICNLTAVAMITGSNRVIAGPCLNSPCCDVTLPEEQQKQQIRRIVTSALKAVSTDIKEQTLF